MSTRFCAFETISCEICGDIEMCSGCVDVNKIITCPLRLKIFDPGTVSHTPETSTLSSSLRVAWKCHWIVIENILATWNCFDVPSCFWTKIVIKKFEGKENVKRNELTIVRCHIEAIRKHLFRIVALNHMWKEVLGHWKFSFPGSGPRRLWGPFKSYLTILSDTFTSKTAETQ